MGCDFHARYQQIAMMDTETGELIERRLDHENGEPRTLYASLPKPAPVGMEATGHAQWFEWMLAELVPRSPWFSRGGRLCFLIHASFSVGYKDEVET